MSCLRWFSIRLGIQSIGFGAAALVATAALGADTPAGSAPFVTDSGARQIQALVSVKQSKTPLQNKIDSRLYLAMLHERGDARLAPLTSYQFLTSDADGRVLVDLALADLSAQSTVVSSVKSLGGSIVHASSTQRLVRRERARSTGTSGHRKSPAPPTVGMREHN